MVIMEVPNMLKETISITTIIIISTLTLPEISSGQQTFCKTLTITALHLPTHPNVFYLQGSLSQRPVYRHQCEELYLFYYSNYTSFWILGPHVGIASGYHMNYDTEILPENISLPWRTWQPSRSVWSSGASVSIGCTDYCQEVKVVGPSFSHLEGPYTLQGTVDNRPIFLHKNRDYKLEYRSGECPQWAIGPTNVPNLAMIVAHSNSSSPLFVTDNWLVYNHTAGEFTPNTDISLICTDWPSRRYMPACGERRKHGSASSAALFRGNPSQAGKWPFVVVLLRADGNVKCGGTIIGARWIMSAGHCLNDTDVVLEKVAVGMHDSNVPDSHTTYHSIKNIHIHPQFIWETDPFRMDYDLGLIELENDIIFNDYVQPACIPDLDEAFPFNNVDPTAPSSQTYNYTDCYIMGWGQSVYNGVVGGTMDDARVTRIVDATMCSNNYLTIQSWMSLTQGVCVLGYDSARLCKGDSGSPLMCQKNGRWTVLAVASWSLTHCFAWATNMPSVYADVPAMGDWISAVLGPFP